MGNIEPAKRSTIAAVIDEIERTPEDALKFNPETHYIQPELTHLNYDLTGRNMPALEYLHQRLGEIKVQNRSDVNIVGKWVWTMPKDLDPKYQEQFFQEIYNYYAEKHGENNICYATVHVDEHTPHIHIGIIPVVKLDKPRKDGKTEKCCYKKVFNKAYLNSEHTDLQIHLGKTLGVEVNLLTGETLGVDGIKNYKAAKDLARKVPELSDRIEELEHDILNKELLCDQLDQEIEQKQGIIRELDKEIGVKRGILGKLKEKIEEVKEAVKEAKEMLTGHPNMFQMFYHWLRGGKEDKKDREETIEDYTDYLDKYDLTIADTDRSVDDLDHEIQRQILKSQDRGRSL